MTTPRGATRPLTNSETSHWATLAATWTTAPPWTDQVRQANRAVLTEMTRLFEDGVSLPTLADTAGWGLPKTSGMLRRARTLNIGTGTRRYIAPTPRPRPEPAYRALTPSEDRTLRTDYGRLPVHANGTSRGWNSPQGRALVTFIESLHADQVSLATIASALGMTRQAVHYRLARAA